MAERREENRKDFSYYMRLVDASSKELVGHLSDISTGGFKLDSEEPISLEQEFLFRLDLTNEVADQTFMTFRARSKWCITDPIEPMVYNVGFHIVEMEPSDRTIFTRVVERYGKR